MTLRRLHRWNAAALGLFLTLHLANHLALLGGHATHGAVLDLLGQIYRRPVIEPVLIGLFAAQAGLGLALALRRGWPGPGWARAQVVSGLVLAGFLAQHIPAVLMARPDTGTAFAAAVVQDWPGAAYFIPYYIAAVAALATHLAAARRFWRWPAPADGLTRALPFAGAAFGCLIVAGLIGAFG